MPEPKSLGLKPAEEKTATENGQPENKAPESKPDVDVSELESEVDQVLGDQGEDDDEDEDIGEDQGDDTVVLPKSKLEKLQRDNKNYRSGLKSVKGKLKALKKPEAPITPKPTEAAKLPDNVLTKDDLAKANEKRFFGSIESGKLVINGRDIDPKIVKDINDNWDKVAPYFTPRRGTDTFEGIAEDVLDAHILFRNREPLPKEDGKDAEREIAEENGAPGSEDNKGGKPTERKHILPRTSSPKEWYPEKGK